MPRPLVHSTALVDPAARLADDVTVGPFSVIERDVVIGPGCKIAAHVGLYGPLVLGRSNILHTGCVIGDSPQHLAYNGERTRVEIGDGNTFREYVTVHRGMPVGVGPGTGVTIIGNNNLFMVNSHVAHDCRIGDGCIFANGALVAGHVTVGDRALISGNSAVHQFCRVGRLALLSGTSAISQDLPPFWIAQSINTARGVNVIGMRRAGISAAEIQAVRRALRLIKLSELTIPEALDRIEAEDGTLPAIREMIEFIRAAKRGIVLGGSTEEDE